MSETNAVWISRLDSFRKNNQFETMRLKILAEVVVQGDAVVRDGVCMDKEDSDHAMSIPSPEAIECGIAVEAVTVLSKMPYATLTMIAKL